jgi:hypothetical protein
MDEIKIAIPAVNKRDAVYLDGTWNTIHDNPWDLGCLWAAAASLGDLQAFE